MGLAYTNGRGGRIRGNELFRKTGLLVEVGVDVRANYIERPFFRPKAVFWFGVRFYLQCDVVLSGEDVTYSPG